MSNNDVAVKKVNVSDIAITGVCIALTLVATAFINIRLPIAANGGLVHLGNVPLFLAAIIFGKKTGNYFPKFLNTSKSSSRNTLRS